MDYLIVLMDFDSVPMRTNRITNILEISIDRTPPNPEYYEWLGQYFNKEFSISVSVA